MYVAGHSFVQAVLQVSGHKALLQHSPTLQKLIEMRNPYIDPINVMQVSEATSWQTAHPSLQPIISILTVYIATINLLTRPSARCGVLHYRLRC